MKRNYSKEIFTDNAKSHKLINAQTGDLNGSQSDNSYFRSYSHLDIHKMMLADSSRTMAYGLALLHSHPQIRHKRVADIGCGTGILSLFAAQSGASSVLAIEASNVVHLAKKTVRDNKLDHKIHVLHCKAEDVELDEPVDVIVSEWMGHCLLYENMLQSVITFRDKFLKPDGLMFPCTASIHIAGYSNSVSLKEETSKFWNELSSRFKLNFDSLKAASINKKLNDIEIVAVEQEDLCSSSDKIIELNLNKLKKEDLSSLQGDFKLQCFGKTKLCSLVLWFDVKFPDNSVLSTSPHDKPTHWQQCLVNLPESVDITQDTVVTGCLNFSQGKQNKRYLEISGNVSFQVPSKSFCLSCTLEE